MPWHTPATTGLAESEGRHAEKYNELEGKILLTLICEKKEKQAKEDPECDWTEARTWRQLGTFIETSEPSQVANKLHWIASRDRGRSNTARLAREMYDWWNRGGEVLQTQQPKPAVDNDARARIIAEMQERAKKGRGW